MISISNLNYRYPGSDKFVLKEIDLTIQSGSLFGLLGPNGAGKTTLISILTGLYNVDKGVVRIEGQCLSSYRQTIKKISGYIPQEYSFYPNLTAIENLQFFSGIQGMPTIKRKQRIDFCLNFCQLERYAKQRVVTFSGGIKRRLNIAIGLLTDPKIIYLDEPTVGIDVQSRSFILDKIKSLQQKGKTIVYTSHYMEEVEKLCDYIAVIDHGEVCIEGTLTELQSKRSSRLEILTTKLLKKSEQDLLIVEFRFKMQGNHIIFENIESIERAIEVMVFLVSIKIEIRKIIYGHNSLEDLFMSITQRTLRD